MREKLLYFGIVLAGFFAGFSIVFYLFLNPPFRSGGTFSESAERRSPADSQPAEEDLFESVSGPDISSVSETSTGIDYPELFDSGDPIIAEKVITVSAEQYFSLPDLENARFKIAAVSKAIGAVPNDICRRFFPSAENFIFVRNKPADQNPPGECFSADIRRVNFRNPSLVVVDLDIVNDGSQSIYGRFVKIFYTVNVGGGNQSLLADELQLSGYGAGPSSSERNLLIFALPEEINEISLVFGNYGPYGVLNGEEELSQSLGGFLVDFDSGSFSEIPG